MPATGRLFSGRIDGTIAWNCFKACAGQKYECLEDLLLWETGLYSHKDNRYFFCAMVRQFAHEEHMEQLRLELYFQPDAGVADLKSQLWSEDFRDRADFFQAVERGESFLTPLTRCAAFAYKLYLEQL